jgi:hypothetical protein
VNSGQVSDRVYGALRARLTDRTYGPGQRLDPALLAEDLSSSVTPVRDALHRLTGEALVTARTSEGFFVPAIDQIGLADLLNWSVDILRAAIAASPPSFRIEPPGVWPTTPLAHAQATIALFGQIVDGSNNLEHRIAASHAAARLAATYQVECALLEDLPSEMLAIASAAAQADRPRLKRLIDLHRRRRIRLGAEIVRCLYRAP